MNTKAAARLLGVESNTVRRWAAEYHAYLSPAAHPPRGHTRVFTPEDLRILHYVAAERDIGRPLETIQAHLTAMQENGWSDLPPAPGEWSIAPEVAPAVQAAARTRDLLTVAVMERDLQLAQKQLENALQRVSDLETGMTALRASQAATEADKHTLQLELEKARGQVATLEARLSSYAIAGGDKPLPVLVIALVTAAAVALLVIVLLIVVRLVL